MTFRSHPDYYAYVKEALPGADFVGEENWYRAPAPKYCLPGDQCGDAHLTGGSGFVQIGNWRIGDVDDGDHFAISREYPGGSAAVFTSRGLAHKGNDRTSLPGTPFYEQAYTLGARKIMAQPQGIRVGDGFIEFNKKWRLWLTPDSKYLAVVHRSGTVAGAWYENDATGGRFLTGTGAPECPAEKDSNGFTYHHYEEHALTEINHGDVCRKGTPSSGGDWWRWECPTHCNKVAGLEQPYCTDKTYGDPCRNELARIDGKAAWSAGFNIYGSENRKVTTGTNGYGLQYLSIGPMRISTFNWAHLTVGSKQTGSMSTIFRSSYVKNKSTFIQFAKMISLLT